MTQITTHYTSVQHTELKADGPEQQKTVPGVTAVISVIGKKFI